jgi:phosphatidylserine synthase
MAIGYLVMIVLAGVYQKMGWSSAMVLALANITALLSFTFFTAYRCQTGKELMLCTKRGWIITGAILVSGLLMYILITCLKEIPISIPFLIAALLVILASIHWSFHRPQNDV